MTISGIFVHLERQQSTAVLPAKAAWAFGLSVAYSPNIYNSWYFYQYPSHLKSCYVTPTAEIRWNSQPLFRRLGTTRK